MTIAHKNHTIKIRCNATFELSVRWFNKTDNVAYHLSDAVFTVKKEEDDTEPLLLATVDNGMMIIDEESEIVGLVGGWATVWIPSSAMENLPYYGGAVYDFVIQRDVDGKELRALEGKAQVSKGISD